MKRDDVFPSKYLKAADLNGKSVTVVIATATFEKLRGSDGKEQDKIVLSFRNHKKTFALNRTNFDAVTDIVGDDETDSWPGHRIELFADKTNMAGKTVDCVRIRAPAQRDLPKAKPVKASAPEQAPEQPLGEEMDDEIPF